MTKEEIVAAFLAFEKAETSGSGAFAYQLAREAVQRHPIDRALWSVRLMQCSHLTEAAKKAVKNCLQTLAPDGLPPLKNVSDAALEKARLRAVRASQTASAAENALRLMRERRGVIEAEQGAGPTKKMIPCSECDGKRLRPLSEISCAECEFAFQQNPDDCK